MLVNNYSEHAFVIDREEASRLLDIETANEEVEQAIDVLGGLLTEGNVTAIGRLARGGGSNDAS